MKLTVFLLTFCLFLSLNSRSVPGKKNKMILSSLPAITQPETTDILTLNLKDFKNKFTAKT